MGRSKTKVGMVGIGMVGTPLKRYFEEVCGYKPGKDLFTYDIDSRKGCGDDVNAADIIFVCVPTPRRADGAASIETVESVLAAFKDNKTVVIKSTVPPGTTEAFQKRYPRLSILFNPEFLTEARAWENTIKPDRQLVGYTKRSKDIASFVLSLLPQAPLMAPTESFELTATEAEMVKYAANLFLTRKVTFANAIYSIAGRLGADYEKIRVGISSDSRIGPSHLAVHHNGYLGYGGYCFVKDTDALIAHCFESGLRKEAELFCADRSFNEILLREQGLTPEDVSIHDHEWIKRKLKIKSKE